jgi:Carbohydrate family 9 binding domain-like
MRKPAIGVALLVGVLAFVLLSNADEKTEAPKPSPIFKSKEPITIDGVLDEPAWKEATPIDVVYIWGKVGEKSKEPRMKAMYAWDENYLYIGYETFDKNLVALGSGEKKGPKGNQVEGALISHEKEKVDVVEFFLSFGDPQIFWEIHHNAANQFNDILITVVDPARPIAKSQLFFDGIRFGTREVIEDDPAARCTRKFAVKLKPKADGKPSTINDSSDTDTGYVGELRLPWVGLGAPRERATTKKVKEDGKMKDVRAWKMDGQPMMILAVFQDGDLKDHYHHSSPTKPGGWFHKGTEHWPRYLLQEKK